MPVSPSVKVQEDKIFYSDQQKKESASDEADLDDSDLKEPLKIFEVEMK